MRILSIRLAPDRPHWRQFVARWLDCFGRCSSSSNGSRREPISIPISIRNDQPLNRCCKLLFPALQLGGLQSCRCSSRFHRSSANHFSGSLCLGDWDLAGVCQEASDLPINEQTWLFPYRGNVLTAKGLVANDHEVGVRPTALHCPRDWCLTCWENVERGIACGLA